MITLFFYGTLRHLPLLETVMGRSVDADDLQQAALPDHCIVWAKGQAFPLILPRAGDKAVGLLAHNLSEEDVARLDYYEKVFGYDLIWVEVETGQGAAAERSRVRMYWPPETTYEEGPAFVLQDWAQTWGGINTRAATEVMGYRGQKSPEDLAGFYGMIHARAASWVAASEENPPRRPGTLGREAVSLMSLERPYGDFFAVEEQYLRFRRYDGGQSDIVKRAAFVATDAALVLPYDPQRDRILLLEQFRMGPWARGDAAPWQLEPIAGRVDAGETPEHCAHREALEEAGLVLQGLELIQRGYPSPGCNSEYFHVYLGLADLPDGLTGVGGVESEQEDIRSLLFSFEEAMALLDQGLIRVTPTQMALLWLARNRDRLRAGA